MEKKDRSRDERGLSKISEIEDVRHYRKIWG